MKTNDKALADAATVLLGYSLDEGFSSVPPQLHDIQIAEIACALNRAVAEKKRRLTIDITYTKDE